MPDRHHDGRGRDLSLHARQDADQADRSAYAGRLDRALQGAGATDLDNLLPVSVDWHHRLHEGGWTIKMGPDRGLKLYRPDGTHDRTIEAPRPYGHRPRDGP